MLRLTRVAAPCLLLVLLGCGGEPKKPEPTDPVISDEFKIQVMKFIETGTETNAKAIQGVAFADLSAQVVSTKAAHDLTLAVWPKDFLPAAQEGFARAVEGWGLALELWGLKIDKGDDPTAPDINGFDRYVAYGLEEMAVERYGKNYLVKEYRGKKHLPIDENIDVLLKLAGTSFETGREQMLQALSDEEGEK